MKGFNLYLNFLAATIIGLAIIGIIVTTIKFLSVEAPGIKTIKIEYHGIKTDSINERNKIEIIRIDSLLSCMKETSNEIQNRQLMLIEEKAKDDFFNKLYAAIVAIILAIAGFFGFKSTNDIRTRAIEEATNESSKIARETAVISAKEEFSRVFDEEYKGGVFEKATEASTKIVSKEINRLEQDLFLLIERVDELENRNRPASEQSGDVIQNETSREKTEIDENTDNTNSNTTNDEMGNPFDE